MTSNNGDLERVLRENLKLRRQVVAEFTKARFGHTVHQWWSARFGRARGSTALLRSPIRADRRHALRLSLDGNAG